MPAIYSHKGGRMLHSRSEPVSQSSSKAATYVFYAFITGLSLLGVIRGVFTWDALGYIAATQKTTNATAIHAAAYSTLPASTYLAFSSSDDPYRKDMAENAYHFVEQLPFYSVKPLYVTAVQIFRWAGLSYPYALVIPSSLSFLFIAVLVRNWLSIYYTPWIAVALSSV